MTKRLLVTGSILAGLSVIFGAFGAHWLKQNISVNNLLIFETAVRYQMYHAFAILFMASLPDKFHIKPFRFAYFAFLIGIILFSGSIYLLATREITGFQLSWIGPVTPLGGLFFVSGWVLIILSAFKATIKRVD